MESFPLARKLWPLAFACAFAAALQLALYFMFTRPALAALAERRTYAGWSWLSVVGWHAVNTAVGVWLVWTSLRERRTRFDAEGVSRPRFLRAPVRVGWAEAESVFVAPPEGTPRLVRINAPRASVEINALHYSDPAALLALIEERMGAAVGAGRGARCDAHLKNAR
ncbi:MAG TPA: hypothetical protein VER32_06695 [Pyrinomonadaceae bacterium]|nr:hypothetical protein [Pyrinomonadaceae bacterium]